MTESSSRIAIIGSGIAGLSAACILSKHHDVTIYESEASLGMDAHSIDVPLSLEADSDKGIGRIDVPLRIFVKTYYPELQSLYTHFGVDSTTVDVASSYTNVNGDDFFHYRNFVVNGWFSIPLVSSASALLRPRFMLNCGRVIYMIWMCGKHAHLADKVENKTFRQYLKGENYTDEFVDNVAIPMAAIICTCSYDAVANYPARVLTDYFARSFLRWNGVERATYGAHEVVTKLSQGCKLQMSTRVQSVTRTDNGCLLVECGQRKTEFDHVIMATPAQIAAKILDSPTFSHHQQLLDTLAQFTAEQSDTICHRDERLMPKDRSIWRSVNLVVVKEGQAPMVTIWVNRVINSFYDCEYDVFQTWNPLITPDPALVISTASLWRPIVTQRTCEALNELTALQGVDNVHICGSWTRFGVPLLEQAARSGIEIAESIGPVQRPWPRCARPKHSSAYSDSMSILMKGLWFVGLLIIWTLVPFSWN